MGISGLLPKLSSTRCIVKLKDLAPGSKIGIDASIWLYKGSYKCSLDLVRGNDTDVYIKSFIDAVRVLQVNGVQPVVVFDGEQLPAKASLNEKHASVRREARLHALSAVREGNLGLAKKRAAAALCVTPDMVDKLMEALNQNHIPWQQAPYEADAQLAYMFKTGLIQYIITEDSDLLVYGASNVIYKYDLVHGTGELVTAADLHKVFPYPVTKFKQMCILSGCDYLPSLAGVGLARAEKFVATFESDDITEELPNIEKILGRSVKLEPGYIEKFREALFVFNHHIVFDESKGCLVPFSPHTPGCKQYPSAGTIDMQLPLQGTTDIYVAMLNLDELDNSSCQDASYDEKDLSYESDGSQHSHLLRSKGDIIIIDAIVSKNHKWTVPCLPVLTLSLALGSGYVSNVPSKLALNMTPPWSTTKLPEIIPKSVQCRSKCDIAIDGQQYVLLWAWEFFLEGVPSDETSGSDTSSDITDEDSENERHSQSDGEDVVIVSDEEKATSEGAGDVEHCLPFKVMGSVYRMDRQDMLMEAKNYISLGEDVVATLKPEPHNVKDPNAIQVILHTNNQPCCVGYIQRELTQYVQPLITNSQIVKVNVAHIKFQLFNPPGFYLKINITRKGRWEAAVLRKSLCVR